MTVETAFVKFSLALQPDAHQQFQAWRRSNPDGYFLNCKTRKTAVLHKTPCWHPGNTTWEPSAEEGNLGEIPKVCSSTRSVLEAWAAENSITVRTCGHCARQGTPIDGPSILPVPPLFGKTAGESVRNAGITEVKMHVPNEKFVLDPQLCFVNEEKGEEFTVGDFWKWAFSDLQANNIRGILSEFIIAKALDINLHIRNTWDDYDLTTKDGIKIEVKSGGYLQTWRQRELSNIVFSGLCGQEWDPANNRRGGEAKYRADIYVFAVQSVVTHDAFNPLDLAQWEFYVVPKAALEKRKVKSISLGTVRKITNPVLYRDLKVLISSVVNGSA